ncbi:MAG: hypothetical protein Q7S22_02705 [Candidatus Micrarchaeota archaeon]|nr:hypothetical protein [Candidatus Micrarchaeota archaeon]
MSTEKQCKKQVCFEAVERIKLFFSVILVAVLFVAGCTGVNNPKTEVCENQPTGFDKDACYFDLVDNGNYSSSDEGNQYCSKIKDWQLRSVCSELVYYG